MPRSSRSLHLVDPDDPRWARDVGPEPTVACLVAELPRRRRLVERVTLEQSMQGRIVLAPCVPTNLADLDLDLCSTLALLQFRRLDLCDLVVVVNAWLDEITPAMAEQIRYARFQGKPISFSHRHRCSAECPCQLTAATARGTLVLSNGTIPGVIGRIGELPHPVIIESTAATLPDEDEPGVQWSDGTPPRRHTHSERVA